MERWRRCAAHTAVLLTWSCTTCLELAACSRRWPRTAFRARRWSNTPASNWMRWTTRQRMTQQQKILLFRNVRRLSTNPGVGLLAGQRQRLSDFGVFGYALASSATLGEALTFGVKHVRLAGPVLEKSLRVEDDMAIFEGHDLL